MIISSMLRVNMEKQNKVSISSILKEGEVEYEIFDIDEISLTEANLSLIDNFDESISPEDAVYRNEEKLVNKSMEQIQNTIDMYTDLLGDMKQVLGKYDVRKAFE